MRKTKGNRTNVMNRSWSSKRSRNDSYNPRKPYQGTPQFDFDQLYILPFTHELTTDDVGRKSYVELTPNLAPTGFRVMDEYIQYLHAGNMDISEFCARYNAKTSDLDGLVFLFTGLSNMTFRNRWMLRTADALLRFTDMGIAEVARRCGAGSRVNLYFAYERDMNCAPSDRRLQLRQKGDLGRYKIC